VGTKAARKNADRKKKAKELKNEFEGIAARAVAPGPRPATSAGAPGLGPGDHHPPATAPDGATGVLAITVQPPAGLSGLAHAALHTLAQPQVMGPASAAHALPKVRNFAGLPGQGVGFERTPCSGISMP
jgi:hypothetical protein